MKQIIEKLQSSPYGKYVALLLIVVSIGGVFLLTQAALNRTRTVPRAAINPNCVASFDISSNLCHLAFQITPASPTPTPTATPRPTPRGTPSPTPTPTATPRPTPTPTPTVSPTATPRPSPTPSTAPAVIGDFVWNDTNHNGIQDTGETGIPGVVVTLYDSQGNVVSTTTTNSSGFYSFTVPAGSYSVGITPPAGYTISPQNQGTNDSTDSDISPTTFRTDVFTVTAGQTDLTHDSGLFIPPPSPSPGLICENIKVYRVTGAISLASSWTLLSSQDLGALRAGDIIYFATLGSSFNGAVIDKARIRVNSSVWTTANETTSIKPKLLSTDPNEFYISYTIPQATATFTAQSEIHDALSNSWY